MPSLYEILNNAHDGEGMSALGREFGLTATCCPITPNRLPRPSTVAVDCFRPVEMAGRSAVTAASGCGRERRPVRDLWLT